MEPFSIVGENGVYVIDESGVKIIAKSDKVKDKKPIDPKMLKVLEILLQAKKPK